MRDANAPYLVIGGQALRALGVDRATHDLDIITSTLDADAAATHRALLAFDQRFNITAEQLTVRNRKVPISSQHGVEVDLLTSVGDLEFADL